MRGWLRTRRARPGVVAVQTGHTPYGEVMALVSALVEPLLSSDSNSTSVVVTKDRCIQVARQLGPDIFRRPGCAFRRLKTYCREYSNNNNDGVVVLRVNSIPIKVCDCRHAVRFERDK